MNPSHRQPIESIKPMAGPEFEKLRVGPKSIITLVRDRRSAGAPTSCAHDGEGFLVLSSSDPKLVETVYKVVKALTE